MDIERVAATILTLPKSSLKWSLTCTLATRSRRDLFRTAASAQKRLRALGGRLVKADAGELLEGISFLPTYGHTPGQMAVEIGTGSDRVTHIGDAAHAWILQFAHPEWTMAFDNDPAQTIKTRRALFAQAAAERTRLLGYHLPFPRIGHVRKRVSGYEWVQSTWD